MDINVMVLNKYGLDRKLLTEVTNFQVDSRLVRSGSIFFALKGSKNSGEDFLREVAINKGVCAFVSTTYSGPDFKLKLIKVDDPLATLHAIAKEKMQMLKGKTIGVTGSVGKTTTKEFIAQLLASDFNVGKSTGNANSQIGLPLTVLNCDMQYEVFVLEMSMSEKGHIQKLVEITRPEIALITKVGYAHAENFESLSKIVEAKAEIFAKDAKVKIVDYDLLQYPCIQKYKPLTFSIYDKRAKYYLDIKQQSIYEDSKKTITLPFPFKEASFLHDLLGAIAVVRQLRMSYDAIQSKILALKIPSMRFEKIVKNNILFINDAYNSNPTSLRAALENLKFYKRRKIGILGPMLELGKYSKKKHFEIGKIAAQSVDILFSIGSECKVLHQAFLEEKPLSFHFSDINLLASKLKQELKAEDVVLIKGSNAVKLEKLFELI